MLGGLTVAGCNIAPVNMAVGTGAYHLTPLPDCKMLPFLKGFKNTSPVYICYLTL